MASARNKAIVERGGHVVLPGFSLFEAGARYPGRKSILAKYVDENGTTFEFIENQPRTRWWIYAVKGGFRMSNTATTSSPEVAEAWRRAVAAGDVSIAPSRR